MNGVLPGLSILQLLPFLPMLAMPAAAWASQTHKSIAVPSRSLLVPAEAGRGAPSMDGRVGLRVPSGACGWSCSPALAASEGTSLAERQRSALPSGIADGAAASHPGETAPSAGGVPGMVDSPMASHIENVVDLRTFGRAVGDGSDATAAIRAAMASADAPVVKVPVGVYGLSAGTYAAGSAVSLVGEGIGKSIIRLQADCAQSGDLLHWVGRDDVLVQDLTLDLNGCAAGSLSGGLAVTGGRSLRLVRVAVVGAGAGPWLLASLNGISHAQVVGSRFQARAAQSSQNQGINVSASYAQGDDVLIEGNTLVNTGALANVRHLRFLGNDVSGWGYGAGISTNPVHSADAVIAGNVLHDSGIGQDADGAWPNGIESWGPRAVIAGNRVSNVAAGLFIGGPDSTVTCNVVTGAGKRADGVGEAGLILGYVSAAQNANGSTLLGNVVADDGTGTTRFGLRDNARTAGVHAPLAANIFAGSVAAARIVGGTNTSRRAAGAAARAEASWKLECCPGRGRGSFGFGVPDSVRLASQAHALPREHDVDQGTDKPPERFSDGCHGSKSLP